VRPEEFEARIRALEGWRAEKAGEERRASTMSAGAGGVVGGVVAGSCGCWVGGERGRKACPNIRREKLNLSGCTAQDL
jgi:hypothetical protein